MSQVHAEDWAALPPEIRLELRLKKTGKKNRLLKCMSKILETRCRLQCIHFAGKFKNSFIFFCLVTR
jgi:hypothetical protein